MATIVDALIVTLGLDQTEYIKGEKEAEKAHDQFAEKVKKNDKKLSDDEKKQATERTRQQKEQQRQQKATMESMAKMRNQIIGMMGLFTAGAGIINFAKDAITSAAAIGRLADNADMSVQDIAGLGQAMERIGGSSEEARASIAMLSKELAKNKAGMESNVIEYMRWQGSIQHGELNTTKNYLLGLSDAFERLNKNSPADAWMKAERMGISENLFNLLKQGRAAVQAQIADGAELTGINRAQTEEAQRSQKAWADMLAHLASVGKAVLFPILSAVAKWMKDNKTNIHEWIGKLRSGIESFSPKALEKVGDTITAIVDGIKLAITAMDKFIALADMFGLGGEKPKVVPSQNMASPVTPMLNMIARAGGSGGSVINKKSDVRVGQITVNTQAKDAQGTAKAVQGVMYNWASQAATGMN